MRPEIQEVLDNAIICGARQLTRYNVPLHLAKHLFPVKKRIVVGITATEKDYHLVEGAIEQMSFADKIVLGLHEFDVPDAESHGWPVARYNDEPCFVNAGKSILRALKREDDGDSVMIWADADVCRTRDNKNNTLRRTPPAVARFSPSGVVRGQWVYDISSDDGVRKTLFKADETEKRLHPEETRETVLTVAAIATRFGFGFAAPLGTNDWGNFPKDGQVFKNGLADGGFRIFTHPAAMEAYEHLVPGEEDYRVNVFLAKRFQNKMSFTPRFMCVKYGIDWVTSSTNNKTTDAYKFYLMNRVKAPLESMGIGVALTQSKGHDHAVSVRLSNQNIVL